MHELAAVDALVDVVVLSVAGHQPCRVDVVRVRRGSTFSEEALRQGFEMLTRGTLLEGARLEVEAVDEVVVCRCGLQRVMRIEDLIGDVWICPNCGHVEASGELDDLTLVNVTLVPVEATLVLRQRDVDGQHSKAVIPSRSAWRCTRNREPLMCLAVPRRVLRVDGGRVEVDWEGGPLWASTVGVSHLEPGEYVLVHAGLVLDRISAEEAEQILALHAVLASDVGDISLTDLAAEAMP